MAILRCNQRAGTSLALQSRQIPPIRETGVADAQGSRSFQQSPYGSCHVSLPISETYPRRSRIET